MTEQDMRNKLQKLFDKNIPVYSYSKLTTWHECKYNYYQNYILHNKSRDNIYNKIGTVVHDGLESIYNHKEDLKDIQNNFKKEIQACEEIGIKFPENPPTTKINYLKNMDHFFNNYKMMDTEMKTEYFILYKIPRKENPKEDRDYIWIQMKIDSIIPVYDKDGNFESVIINDWKTSSKFNKEKLIKAGNQLLIYKLGVEQAIGVNVSKIGWTMLKYVYCCYMTKGSKSNPSKVKKSIKERKDSAKHFHKKIVNDFIKNGMDTIEAELKAGKIINENNLKLLPKEIQEKYWIEDCFLEYEFDDDIIRDCIQWIKNTVNEIESIDKIEKNYPPVEIGDKTSYFCFNLCGRPNCIHLVKYKNENKDKFKKEKKEKSINDLFNDKKKIKMNLDSLFK
ncbi:PD-(D/E)XK nuclease family protein [Clostridium botulinum]